MWAVKTASGAHDRPLRYICHEALVLESPIELVRAW